jgi:cytoskeletal protein RodZ
MNKFKMWRSVMNENKGNGKKIFFIALIVLGFFIGGPVVGIIILLFFVNFLKKQNNGKNNTNTKTKTNTKNYYNMPPASGKRENRKRFEKTQEQKNKDKWEKRRDKDPWEWDE